MTAGHDRLRTAPRTAAMLRAPEINLVGGFPHHRLAGAAIADQRIRTIPVLVHGAPGAGANW